VPPLTKGLLLPLAIVLPLLAGAALVERSIGGPSSAGAATGGTLKVAFLQGEQIAYVDRPGSTAEAAVRALLAGPTRSEAVREVTTQVPAGTPLRSISVAGTVATVDLGEQFATGTRADSLSARIAQLVLTLTRRPGIRSVKVLVKGGVPLGLFPGIVTRYALTPASVQAPTAPPPDTPVPPPSGEKVPEMRALQQRLADLGFLPAEAVDGKPGPRTTFAVVAFQKWARLGRDGAAGPATMSALQAASRPAPIRSGTGRRMEVLIDRQLALLIDGSTVTRVLNVSTGKAGFDTPVGNWKVERKEERSWSVPYKVWLPWASYFVGGVAFHEYPDVPPEPASHGCVRVPVYDAEWLYRQIPNGTPITVIGRS
jgi:lipoprotein-anchoring transpeptidase ErfK/SrfK